MDMSGLYNYDFEPHRPVRMDCRAFDMVAVAAGRTVETTFSYEKQLAPLKSDGPYRSKEECRDVCFASARCRIAQFWIRGEEPSTCDLTTDCNSV